MITKIAKRLDSLEKDIQEIKTLLKSKKKTPVRKIISVITGSPSEPGCHKTYSAGHC